MENLGSNTELLLGKEFLTWLWFRSENNRGTFHTIKEQIPYVIYIEQRIVVRGGEGDTVETASVSGIHSALREAKLGLNTGKMVVSALLRLEKHEFDWQVTLKAEDFALNSLRTPAIAKEDKEMVDAEATFLEKVFLIDEALELIDDAYCQFIQLRVDSKNWESECKAIRGWIQEQ